MKRNEALALAALALSLLAAPAMTGCDPQPSPTPAPEASVTAEAPPALSDGPDAMGPPPPPGPPAAAGGAASFDTKPFKGNGKPVTTKSGLKYEDMTVGTGKEATAGSTAVVHYTGTLTDGTKFDSSRDRGEPFTFPVGAGQVIPGWDEGVAGMKVGGRRKLTVPPDLGYGAQGTPGGPIPPNATLIFDVELMDVQ